MPQTSAGYVFVARKDDVVDVRLFVFGDFEGKKLAISHQRVIFLNYIYVDVVVSLVDKVGANGIFGVVNAVFRNHIAAGEPNLPL